MTNHEIASALIQTIGLFLPAWAIMVQIFARLMEKTDLDDSPGLIPLFAIGLALALRSFNSITLATLSHLLSTALESAQEGSITQLQADAFLSLTKGNVLFSYLGLIVLIIAVLRFFERKNGAHVGLVAILGYFITGLGMEFGVVTIAWAMIFLLVVDVLICLLYWDSIKTWIDQSELWNISRSL